MIRLYVEGPLSKAASVAADGARAHYLGTVMRRAVGDTVSVFNGRDGEWRGRIASLDRRGATLHIEDLIRAQSPEPDVWLVFAALKRDMTDLVAQKATELGVSVLLPVFTERTVAARVNVDRLRAIAVEAAEQSERLTVPTLHPAQALEKLLADWPADRPLFVALERSGGLPMRAQSGPAALLVGPEGGFGPRDRAVLRHAPFSVAVSLGPRILRAETAAIAGLALLQAASCG